MSHALREQHGRDEPPGARGGGAGGAGRAAPLQRRHLRAAGAARRHHRRAGLVQQLAGAGALLQVQAAPHAYQPLPRQHQPQRPAGVRLRREPYLHVLPEEPLGVGRRRLRLGRLQQQPLWWVTGPPSPPVPPRPAGSLLWAALAPLACSPRGPRVTSPLPACPQPSRTPASTVASLPQATAASLTAWSQEFLPPISPFVPLQLAPPARPSSPTRRGGRRRSPCRGPGPGPGGRRVRSRRCGGWRGAGVGGPPPGGAARQGVGKKAASAEENGPEQTVNSSGIGFSASRPCRCGGKLGGKGGSVAERGLGVDRALRRLRGRKRLYSI